jgi:hypothetical protein
VVIGAAAASRYGVVVVDAVQPVDGVVRIRGTVVGRDLVVAFTGEEWEQSTRPVVTTEVAERAWEALRGPRPDVQRASHVVEVLQGCHEASLGMDFAAKVDALRELHTLDEACHPARKVVALELQQALVSELGHVLDRDPTAVMAELGSQLDRAAPQQASSSTGD